MHLPQPPQAAEPACKPLAGRFKASASLVAEAFGERNSTADAPVPQFARVNCGDEDNGGMDLCGKLEFENYPVLVIFLNGERDEPIVYDSDDTSTEAITNFVLVHSTPAVNQLAGVADAQKFIDDALDANQTVALVLRAPHDDSVASAEAVAAVALKLKSKSVSLGVSSASDVRAAYNLTDESPSTMIVLVPRTAAVVEGDDESEPAVTTIERYTYTGVLNNTLAMMQFLRAQQFPLFGACSSRCSLPCVNSDSRMQLRY